MFIVGLSVNRMEDEDAQRNTPKEKCVSCLPCYYDLIPVREELKGYFGFQLERIKSIMERKAWWKVAPSWQECAAGPSHFHLDVTGSRKLTGSAAWL